MIDHAAAIAGRDAALAQVEANALKAWKARAADIVAQLAREGDYFTTDDVWLRLEATPDLVATPEPRALGAVMRNAARAGLIRPTGRVQPSGRPAAHHRPIMLWAPTARGGQQ